MYQESKFNRGTQVTSVKSLVEWKQLSKLKTLNLDLG